MPVVLRQVVMYTCSIGLLSLACLAKTRSTCNVIQGVNTSQDKCMQLSQYNYNGSGVFRGTCWVLMKKSERSTPSALQASHCCCPVFSTKAMPPVSREPSKGTWMVTACTAMSGREG